MPDVCTTCFDRYSWKGSLNSTNMDSSEPAFKLEQTSVKFGKIRAVDEVHLVTFLAAVAAVFAVVFV